MNVTQWFNCLVPTQVIPNIREQTLKGRGWAASSPSLNPPIAGPFLLFPLSDLISHSLMPTLSPEPTEQGVTAPQKPSVNFSLGLRNHLTFPPA